jgi:hypothetical protein
MEKPKIEKSVDEMIQERIERLKTGKPDKSPVSGTKQAIPEESEKIDVDKGIEGEQRELKKILEVSAHSGLLDIDEQDMRDLANSPQKNQAHGFNTG